MITLCLLLFLQDDVGDPQLIEELKSTSIDAREHAQSLLHGMGRSALPALKRHLAGARDPEVRARLRDTIFALEPTSEELWSKGLVNDALAFIARLEGESGSKAYICKRISEVREVLEKEWAPLPLFSHYSWESSDRLASRLGIHRYWIVLAAFEFLGDSLHSRSWLMAWCVIRDEGCYATPILLERLKTSSVSLRVQLCILLAQTADDRALPALHELLNDSKQPWEVRKYARQAYRRIARVKRVP